MISYGSIIHLQVIVSEPYANGPGGSGLYTRKVFHVGSRIPAWLRAFIPKNAMTVEEEVRLT